MRALPIPIGISHRKLELGSRCCLCTPSSSRTPPDGRAPPLGADQPRSGCAMGGEKGPGSIGEDGRRVVWGRGEDFGGRGIIKKKQYRVTWVRSAVTGYM